MIERKAEIKESKRWVVRAFQQRPSSWVSRALNEQLTPFGVDQIPYQELLINPDFDKVCKKLQESGCYVDINVHGNEKFLVRWVGSCGNNKMAWGIDRMVRNLKWM